MTVALLAAVASPAWLARPVRASAPTSTAPVTVTVTGRELGRPIPSGFIGFSFEFGAVRDYTGSNPRAINPVLVQLIRNLTPRQSPVLRIGGDSTDETWWPLPHTQPSPGIQYTLTRSWLTTTKRLAIETGGKLILGLNLKLDSRAEVAAEARAYRTGIGRRLIDAFEIGNEPELYPVFPYYYEQPGQVPVFARSRPYNFADYAREVSALARELRGIRLAGPATGVFSWLTHLGELFTAERRLAVVTYHRYPLIKCFTKPGDPGYPTIPNLLSLRASRDLLAGAAGLIALAHRHGATFRIDELNSVACKGQEGVSDTFASALWMLDTLFSMARSGVDGVNIHTLPGAAYKPFTFTHVGRRWLATVSPEYYGLLMFVEAAPPGSRLLAVNAPTSPDLRELAALTPTGLIHLVLINDSLTSVHFVRVRAPRHVRGALLERLSAPSAAATGGVTLAGQSFGTETATGTLTGRSRIVRLSPIHGRYVIRLPAASAAMVSFAAGAVRK